MVSKGRRFRTTGPLTISGSPTSRDKKRADERTRTADLLITSELSRLHRCFQVFQKPPTSAVFTFCAFLDVPWCSPGLLSRLLSNYVPGTSLEAQISKRAGSIRTICGRYLREWSRRLTYGRWPMLVSTALNVGKRGVRGTVWRDGHSDSLRAPGFPWSLCTAHPRRALTGFS